MHQQHLHDQNNEFAERKGLHFKYLLAKRLDAISAVASMNIKGTHSSDFIRLLARTGVRRTWSGLPLIRITGAGLTRLIYWNETTRPSLSTTSRSLIQFWREQHLSLDNQTGRFRLKFILRFFFCLPIVYSVLQVVKVSFIEQCMYRQSLPTDVNSVGSMLRNRDESSIVIQLDEKLTHFISTGLLQ